MPHCQLLESSGLPLEWTVEARADQAEFELLKRMKETGLRCIQIGLESGDRKLLDRMGKKLDKTNSQ